MSAQQWVPFELTWAASIAGQVTDGVTGAAISGARVQIVKGPKTFDAKRRILANDPGWERKKERLDQTFSQADGIYVLTNLPSGLYRLQVTAPAPSSRYATAETPFIRVWATRDPEGRIKLDPANVVLSPTRIHGRVTRADTGQPVEGARVRLRGDINVVRTDAEGGYALANLVASSPTLEVVAANLVTASQALSLEAGQDLEVNVVLQPA
jgi:hypothetical protein